MNESPLVQELKERLGARALTVQQTDGYNIFVDVKAEDVPDCVRIVWNDMQSRFAIITGIDVVEGIELLYHFCFDAQRRVVTLKTKVAKPFPEIESVTPICPAAEWIEREVYDMLGVKFRNHPKPKRLLLSDDWPDGVFPLRKDFRPKDANE